MIRFACGQCGRSLRAPSGLAGKRGRCARCGAVNAIPPGETSTALMAPPVVSVDVKRSGRQSPFRSTADLEPARATVEGAIEVANARYLADRPPVGLAEIGGDPTEILPFQAVEEGTTNEGPIEGEEWPAEPAPRRTSRPNGAHREGPLSAHPGAHPDAQPGYDLNFEHRGQEVLRAVIAALLVGGVVGFCVGLFACKWLV